MTLYKQHSLTHKWFFYPYSNSRVCTWFEIAGFHLSVEVILFHDIRNPMFD